MFTDDVSIVCSSWDADDLLVDLRIKYLWTVICGKLLNVAGSSNIYIGLDTAPQLPDDAGISAPLPQVQRTTDLGIVADTDNKLLLLSGLKGC